MSVLPALCAFLVPPLYVCPQKPEENITSTDTRIQSCEPSCKRWEFYPGPLEEQLEPLISEPPSSSIIHHFKTKTNYWAQWCTPVTPATRETETG